MDGGYWLNHSKNSTIQDTKMDHMGKVVVNTDTKLFINKTLDKEPWSLCPIKVQKKYYGAHVNVNSAHSGKRTHPPTTA